MSGSSSANNSWTIVTPEETAAETLRPLAEGGEHHGERTSAAGSGDDTQPANDAESAKGLPVEACPVSVELSRDSSTDQQTSVPTIGTDTLIPSSSEVSGNLVHGSDEVGQPKGLPEGLAQFSPDPNSSSDSYTHVTPSPEEPPFSPLRTDTLGGAEFPLNGEELHQEEEEEDRYPKTTDLGKQEAPDSPVDDSDVVEERTEKTGEEGDPEVRRRSLLAALEQIGRREEEIEEEEFHMPQRDEDSGFSLNKCILGAIILVGLGTIFFSGVFMDLDEESDYGTRELKDTEVPGKQEWRNPEVPPAPVDADSLQLLNKLAEGNEQISVLQAQLQAQNEELKVAKGQAAVGEKERLRWEEVEKENSRLKTEMASLPVLQKENERMKKELESIPALQKELETLRSTVTELKLSSAPSQSAKAPVKPTTSPPTGQPEDSKQATAVPAESQARKPLDDQKEKKKDLKKDKHDMGKKDKHDMGKKTEWKEKQEKSTLKEGEKKERKDGGKREGRKENYEQEMSDNEKMKESKQKRHGDETKQWKEKDWKKEKATRGDEGKPWKDREVKKEWVEKSEKKERKEEKDRKKVKHEKVDEGKQWKGKEENKDWKGGKDRGNSHKVKEEWKGEKEWRKVKDGSKESGKEKWAKKDWKEKGENKEWKKGENKEWKKDTEQMNKNDKDHRKEGKGQGERKQWEDSKSYGKERTGKDERKQSNEWKSKDGKHEKEWKRKDDTKEQWNKKEEDWKSGQKKQHGDGKKDGSNSQKKKDVHKFAGNHGHKEEHLYVDQKPSHTHHRPSMGQPEYWLQQRNRLQHNPKPPQQCNSLESCARAERLHPVPLPEFEAILQTYLAKAAEVGVEESKREELKKLATEFFKNGVFVHDQMSFHDFVEDVGDILEDMVEGDEEEEEEDSAIEEEMEEFEKEIMKKFSIPGAGEKEEKIKGEWRKESSQGRG